MTSLPIDAITATTLVLSVRLIVALVFIPAALGKLRDLPGFVQGVVAYRLLPTWAARAVALVLPWAELVLALALLAGVALPLAGAALMVLLGGFIAAVVINLRRGRLIACNCHGFAATRTISWGTVARNALLVLYCIPLLGAPMGGWPPWAQDLTRLSSLAIIPLLLVTASGLVLLALVEWAIDISMRLAQLQRAG